MAHIPRNNSGKVISSQQDTRGHKNKSPTTIKPVPFGLVLNILFGGGKMGAILTRETLSAC